MRIANSLFDLRRRKRKGLLSVDAVVVMTAFDPANKSTSVTLSEANMRMTSDTTDRGVKAIRTNNSGKRYFEVQVVGTDPGGGVGLALAAQSVDDWVGATANSVGIDTGNRQVYSNNSTSGVVGIDTALGQNDVLGVCADYTLSKMWFSRNGAFASGQNPLTNTGGYAIPAGASYIMVSANAGNSFRLRNYATQFSAAIPSGYSEWGG